MLREVPLSSTRWVVAVKRCRVSVIPKRIEVVTKSGRVIVAYIVALLRVVTFRPLSIVVAPPSGRDTAVVTLQQWCVPPAPGRSSH